MSLDRDEFFRQVAHRICSLARIMHEKPSCIMQASDEPGRRRERWGDQGGGKVEEGRLIVPLVQL